MKKRIILILGLAACTWASGGFIASPGMFPATMALSSLESTNGFCLYGSDQGQVCGRSVSGAGDINGDAIDDLLVGAYGADPGGSTYAGETYVVFGHTNGFDTSTALSSLDGTNGFCIAGIDPYDLSGDCVSSAGDINGDGFDDIIIGANGASHDGKIWAGESYVVFGKASGFAVTQELSSLDGTNGFCIAGIDANDKCGISVSGAGDVNGDGIDDLIIGAYRADSATGESYVIFGKTNRFSALLDPSSLNGSDGFRIYGAAESDSCGISVDGAGDVNGDGIDDLIVGAFWAAASGNEAAGASYVLFGHTNSFDANMTLSSLNGTNGFCLEGIDENDQSGVSVSGAGDVNGDGIDDIIIGAFFADPQDNEVAGETYVVFGHTNGFNASMPLSSLNGTNGFCLEGIAGGDMSGRKAKGAGDVNGDGLDDIIIGAHGADDAAGECYIVFGQTNAFSASLPLSSLNGTNGFRLDGIDEGDKCGLSVSGAGDVNGDGIDDLIVGAGEADREGNGMVGECYVIFGRQGGGVSPSSGLFYGSTTVTITGFSLGNGSDITNVTICGVSASILRQTAGSVTVEAGPGPLGIGDVVVQSASGGATIKNNGFEYVKASQVIDFPSIGKQVATNAFELTASASSGLSVTNFSIVSGPAHVDGNILSFTGAGIVVAAADQAGSPFYSAAPTAVSTGTVSGAAGLTTYADAEHGCDSSSGLSWAAAKQTIQAAIGLCGDGSSVWVTNGIYSLGEVVMQGFAATNRICITNNITVRSVNGPAVTIIDGGGALRCACLTDGTLSGLTLTNGYAVIAGGALLYGGRLENCILSGSAAEYGGGAFLYSGGRLNNCLLTGNSARDFGGGASLYQSGTLNNCTLAGNMAANSGGGAYLFDGGSLNNSIVYSNSAAASRNIYSDAAGSIFYTCAGDGVINGVNGCITNAPLFMERNAGNFRLSAVSPCIDAGTAEYAADAVDIDGNARIVNGTVDMGAYEYDSFMYDTDGDGSSDYSEYIADTSLTNGADYFCISGIDGDTVKFSSSSNRFYTLLWSTNLAEGSWYPALSRMGTGGADSITGTNAAPAVYYKLEVKVP